MRILINQCEIIEDRWLKVGGAESLPRDHRIIVSRERLCRDWEQLELQVDPLAVELDAGDAVEDISALLSGLALVVLNFGGFTDGRAFSQARLLRERFAFTGDIRAQGEVLRDQLSFMQRCGISQFYLADSEEATLALAAFSEISKSYQPELLLQEHC